MGEFEATLRAQIAEAHHAVEQARAARDYAGIRSCGLRLRYLLEIAEEHRVPVDETLGDTATDGV